MSQQNKNRSMDRSDQQPDQLKIPMPLVENFNQARRVVVLTGAGISAESGVPTFREAQTGLWAQYDPQELATPAAFSRNPRLVWEWYTWRRELISKAEPNAGHLALAELENRVSSFTLVTQNIDGLHARAGSQRVIELHGNIHRVRCFDEDVAVANWRPSDEVPPRCPNCGGRLRPDVVWFGEQLPQIALTAAVEASRTCDIFISIGTSALVHPAASLPLEAVKSGAITIEVNPQATPITQFMDYVLAGPAGVVLPALMSRMEHWQPV